MAAPTYATREAVKRALDSAETARSNTRIDRALASATSTVNQVCRRRFHPTLATRYFDWPNQQYARPWRLWLDSNELVEAYTVTAGGTIIPASDYFLRRSDDRDEPPYTHVEINLASSAGFAAGATPQRSIAIYGLYAGCPVAETPAGTLAEALDDSETGVDVTDSATVGIGDLIRVESERMVVTGKSMLDTGQNLQVSLTASTADVTVAVTTGSAFVEGEIILIGAERMLVVDIAGNNLIVKRPWDGSVLAAHTAPTADIYAPRTLTVERGAQGTTPAEHSTAAAVARWDPPPLVHQMCLAEAMVELEAQGSGYAKSRGSGGNKQEPAGGSLEDLRERVCRAHRRKLLVGAV